MNGSKDSSSKKQGKSSASDNVSDYTYSPKVETPNPKSTTDKKTFSNNTRGV